MKASAYLLVILFALMLVWVGGCCPADECHRNARLAQERLERLQDLEAAQERELLRADQLQQELNSLSGQSDACNKKIQLLQAALEDRMEQIRRLSAQTGPIVLPVELSDALARWAENTDMVSYDSERGIVQFKSDLLFKLGSDEVQGNAMGQLKAFAAILNSSAAEGFDVLIVGHTDDMPVTRPETLKAHPTNWHLSAHRAISVQKVLAEAGVAEQRTAVVGMGEFRPQAPNKEGKRGNPLNRRVEIYIVPSGSIRITG